MKYFKLTIKKLCNRRRNHVIFHGSDCQEFWNQSVNKHEDREQDNQNEQGQLPQFVFFFRHKYGCILLGHMIRIFLTIEKTWEQHKNIMGAT